MYVRYLEFISTCIVRCYLELDRADKVSGSRFSFWPRPPLMRKGATVLKCPERPHMRLCRWSYHYYIGFVCMLPIFALPILFLFVLFKNSIKRFFFFGFFGFFYQVQTVRSIYAPHSSSSSTLSPAVTVTGHRRGRRLHIFFASPRSVLKAASCLDALSLSLCSPPPTPLLP